MYAFAMLQSENFGLDFLSLMNLSNFGKQTPDLCFPKSPDTNQPTETLCMEHFLDTDKNIQKEPTEEAF